MTFADDRLPSGDDGVEKAPAPAENPRSRFQPGGGEGTASSTAGAMPAYVEPSWLLPACLSSACNVSAFSEHLWWLVKGGGTLEGMLALNEKKMQRDSSQKVVCICHVTG